MEMLKHIRGRVSERKLRLFACGCLRRLWDPISDNCLRRAIEVAERYAEDPDGNDELRSATRGGSWEIRHAATARRQAQSDEDFDRTLFAAHTADDLLNPNAWAAAADTLHATTRLDIRALGSAHSPEDVAEAELLREIVGNPDRPSAVDPRWLTWNHGTVPAIARHIYEDRAFHDLPILADALEDAGCADAAILDHCCGPGPHVRGCWVVDLLLGQT
jgi:hypothetical protein